MKLIENLEELKIGDWVKVYSKDYNKIHFKLGEIMDRWEEKAHPCFELKVFKTNIPLTTLQMIERLKGQFGLELKKYTESNCDEDDRIFKLDEKEKNTLVKKMMMDNL